MSIAQITFRLQSVNSILGSCVDSGLSFDAALILATFYRDYSDTNGLIESAEKEAAEDADRLLTDTVSLLSEIEKFSEVGVAGIQSVDFEQLLSCNMVYSVAQTIKPYERGKRWAEEFLNICGISKTYYEKHRTDICSQTATDENKKFRKSIDNAMKLFRGCRQDYF